MSKPTNPAIDDYLKTIYHHTEWQDEKITASRLATELRLAPSTVTEMVQKLAAQGLVVYHPYRPISLSEEGVRRATAVIRRHRLIETWLVQDMGYAWDEVHDEAEILEHALSDRLLEAIDERLGRPSHDPHGDAIPAADGSVPREDFVRLDQATIGHSGRVLRISDRDPEVLRMLHAHAILPGATVTVTAVDVVSVNDVEVALPTGAGSDIWLTA